MAAKLHTKTDDFFRPDPQMIAQPLGLKLDTLPSKLIESHALCQTLTKAVKGIDKDRHLHLWATDELQLKKTNRFQKNVRKLSQHAFFADEEWGTLKLQDASFGTADEFFCGVKLVLYPNAIVEDPLILTDVCEYHGSFVLNHALDVALTRELLPTVFDGYDGPGYAYAHEGDKFNEGMVIEIGGDPNEVLDAADVASGLLEMFSGDQFNDLILHVVEDTKAIHNKLRRRA